MNVCVIGGANVDIISIPKVFSHSIDSHPGKVCVTAGGVARNIAENLVRLGVDISFITILGDDSFGNFLIDDARMKGIDISNAIILSNTQTACYNAILDPDGDLRYAIADMDIMTHLNPQCLKAKKDIIGQCDYCILDSNLSQESIEYIVSIPGPRYVVDTVSGAKAHKISHCIDKFFLIKSNPQEIMAIVSHNLEYQHLLPADYEDIQHIDPTRLETILEHIGLSFVHVGLTHLVVSLGSRGLWYMGSPSVRNSPVPYTYINSKKAIALKNATGAGDALCAGILSFLCMNSDTYTTDQEYTMETVTKALQYGLAASIITVQNENSVAPELSVATINQVIEELL